MGQADVVNRSQFDSSRQTMQSRVAGGNCPGDKAWPLDPNQTIQVKQWQHCHWSLISFISGHDAGMLWPHLCNLHVGSTHTLLLELLEQLVHLVEALSLLAGSLPPRLLPFIAQMAENTLGTALAALLQEESARPTGAEMVLARAFAWIFRLIGGRWGCGRHAADIRLATLRATRDKHRTR